ncbi:TetR/AcrR family transcriptional regulator [[Clostridium] innocuum]|uniref:TetR/AcrR family transcriptional regulator n=1 Tax=Clostridium innocuum TaxID=1522 RepID=UPI001E46C13A|nr:TetR/AcrR family transcriptional regulator [[Clostridium] innocuum]MCC2837906.1 TetR/AcrR family transcriptional regulator [[Clostridium] innocuum]
MEQLSTKERIRTEALHLFAQYGYDAISVAQIAKAVGIQAPSLYKQGGHFSCHHKGNGKALCTARCRDADQWQ